MQIPTESYCIGLILQSAVGTAGDTVGIPWRMDRVQGGEVWVCIQTQVGNGKSSGNIITCYRCLWQEKVLKVLRQKGRQPLQGEKEVGWKKCHRLLASAEQRQKSVIGICITGKGQ